MSLTLYNTLTRRKEPFEPLDRNDVRLYVCGPTVYDRAHIGNARPVIVFDVLFRLLRHLYGADHVRYVRNITDVDDKIIARAAEREITIDELTETTTRQFEEDVGALGCLKPTVEPRATQHISEMIAVIERLVASGHAYAAQGHVLFDVPSMPAYGRLSKRPLDEMVAGARVEVAPYKRYDADFVLWKPASGNEPQWDSPWGRGRPGWHIECSAMSWKHLGETFDIHGGGIDLVFPHHENELAQSCCAFDRPFMAQVWMHNGFLQVEGEKMSKSLGNFVTIREVLDRNPNSLRWGDIIRLNMLRTHYRQPINWTHQALAESEAIYRDFESAVRGQGRNNQDASTTFVRFLSDDLNTPAAIAEMQHLARSGRSGSEAAGKLIACLSLVGFEAALSFTLENNELREAYAKTNGVSSGVGEARQVSAHLTASGSMQIGEFISIAEARTAGLDPAKIEALIAERLAARTAKDWAASDRIRDELTAMGIELKDGKDGTTWSVGRKGGA